MNEYQLHELADRNGWQTTSSDLRSTILQHPQHGALSVSWKTSRRRPPAVEHVRFYIPDRHNKLHFKAILSARSGNVREAITHFMEGHGVATRKAG